MFPRALAFMILCLLAIPVAAHAEERVRSFTARIDVSSDGAVLVQEQIAITTGKDTMLHGIVRDLPGMGPDVSMTGETIAPQFLAAKRDGADDPYDAKETGGVTIVRIGRSDVLVPPGLHVYELTYSYTKAVKRIGELDVLSWNVTGNGWPFTIDSAQVVVHLPEGTSVARYEASTGETGASGTAYEVIDAQGTVFRARTARQLQPSEGFSIALGWRGGKSAQAVAPQAGVVQQGSRVTFGPAQFVLPAGWVRREGTPDDNPHYDAPGPNPGLGPTVAFVIEDTVSGTPPADEGTTITGTEKRRISGHLALVQHWLWEEDDTQGITLFFRNVVPGKTVKVYGWISRTDWEARYAELWAVLNSISFTDGDATASKTPETAAAPQPPPEAEPPPQPGTPVKPADAAETREWRLGKITLSAPLAWEAFVPAQLLSLDGGDWEVMLSEDPKSSRAGGFLVFTWAQQPVLHAAEVDPARRQPNRAVTMAGMPATRTDYGPGAGEDVQGFDVITDAPLSGRYLVLSCRMPSARWAGEGQNCEAALASVALAGDAAGEPASGATPPAPPKQAQAAPGGQAPPEQAPAFLFDGTESAAWLPLAYSGGDFAAFARYDGAALAVDVPAGHGWANTGLRSTAPVVPVPSAVSGRAVRLRFLMDPAATTGALFSLVPAERAGQDHWGAHEIRLAYVEPDGQPALLMLHAKQYELGRYVVTDKSVLSDLSLWLRPDHSLAVTDAAGQVLIQAGMTGLTTTQPLTLYAEAGAPAANEAVRLRLAGIRMETPAVVPNPDAAALLSDQPETSVLFDGSLYAPYFTPYWARGSDFARDAHVSDGALRVSVPAGSEWGKVGLSSPSPVVWLDRLSSGTEVRLGFDFDAAQTTGFAISLSGTSSLNGNDASNPRFYLEWRREMDGVVRATRVYDYDLEKRSAEIPQGMPGHVDLVLTKAGLQVVAEGFPADIVPWALLADGTGLRLTIYSLAAADGQPVTMVVKRVTLTRTPGGGGGTAPPSAPQAGVEALPETVYFDGTPDAAWEGRSAGEENFASLAEQRGTATLLRRRDPTPNADRIALISRAPLADLDERIGITPYELRLKLGPVDDLGAQIWLSDDPARYADTARARLSLRVLRTGVDAGGLEIQLYTGNFFYDNWRRVLPAGTWQKDWDGSVRLRLGPGWIAAAIGDAWVVRGQSPGIARDAKMVVAVAPGGVGDTEPGQLLLERISGGWITPPGMDATLRFSLVDDANFDPEVFADMMAKEISEDMP